MKCLTIFFFYVKLWVLRIGRCKMAHDDMLGYYAGYISPTGEFFQCSEDCESYEGHRLLEKQLHHSEDYLMSVMGYVKLSKALYREYLFRGAACTHYCLTPEQVQRLEELGYEVDEYDKL